MTKRLHHCSMHACCVNEQSDSIQILIFVIKVNCKEQVDLTAMQLTTVQSKSCHVFLCSFAMHGWFLLGCENLSLLCWKIHPKLLSICCWGHLVVESSETITWTWCTSIWDAWINRKQLALKSRMTAFIAKPPESQAIEVAHESYHWKVRQSYRIFWGQYHCLKIFKAQRGNVALWRSMIEYGSSHKVVWHEATHKWQIMLPKSQRSYQCFWLCQPILRSKKQWYNLT